MLDSMEEDGRGWNLCLELLQGIKPEFWRGVIGGHLVWCLASLD
jgi:hypothetical protein